MFVLDVKFYRLIPTKREKNTQKPNKTKAKTKVEMLPSINCAGTEHSE